MTRVLALCGGVGGAKLAAGLAEVVAADELMVVVNTGDDFEHLGLTICPDLDSTLYALADINDSARGWGRRDEDWKFLSSLKELNGPVWFQLGDRDIATHVLRSHRLSQGASLTQVTAEFATALGVKCRVVPMSDGPIRTVLHTDQGTLSFQDYFVRLQCKPKVQRIEYTGAKLSRPSDEVMTALESSKLECVVICPSNPWLSIDPMLAMPTLAFALRATEVPIIAVSPIVAGRAVKGPVAEIMRSLGHIVDPVGIARHYRNFIKQLVIDHQDAASGAAISELEIESIAATTLMKNRQTRLQLAETVLDAARRWRDRGGPSRPQNYP